MYPLTNERYKTYQMEFSFGRLGHDPGWDLWVPLGVGGSKIFFSQNQPDFYGDLVYKLKKIVGSNNFSAQFIKIISHYKKIGYNINVLQQTACLVVNPITVGNFAFLFNCTPVGRTSDSMMVTT